MSHPLPCLLTPISSVSIFGKHAHPQILGPASLIGRNRGRGSDIIVCCGHVTEVGSGDDTPLVRNHVSISVRCLEQTMMSVPRPDFDQ